MSFQGKYQLLCMLRDGDARCLRARQTSSGQTVLVHLLRGEQTPPNQPDLASLVFKFLRSGPTEGSEHFLDMGEEEGRMFVVTSDLPQCVDLRTWLQPLMQAQENKGTGGVLPPVGEAPQEGAGTTRSFPGFTSEMLGGKSRLSTNTQAFSSPSVLQTQPPPSISGKTPDTLETPATGSPTSPAHGGTDDFARFFENLSPTEASGTSPAPSAAPPALPSQKEPGEFTKAFLASQPEPNAEPAPARESKKVPSTTSGLAKANDEPGEFSRMFLASSPATKSPEPAAAGRDDSQIGHPQSTGSPASPEPGMEPPGQFTKLFFGKDETAQKAEPPAPPSRPEGRQQPVVKPSRKRLRGQIPAGFEVVFRSQKQTPGAFSPPVPDSPAAVVPQAPQTHGKPGEFTSLFFNSQEPSAATPGPRPSGVGTKGLPAASAVVPQGPGEFTRLFSKQPGSVEVPEMPRPEIVASKRAVSQPASPVTEGPGEFTKFFQQGDAKSPETEQALPRPSQRPEMPLISEPASDQPGEFTRLFQSQQKPMPVGQEGLPARAPESPMAPASPIGTSDGRSIADLLKGTEGAKRQPPSPVLRGPSQPAVPRSSSSVSREPGEFTRLMQGYKPPRVDPSAPALEPAKPSSPLPAPGPGQSAPGEFTLLFQQPARAAAPPPQAAVPLPSAQPAPVAQQPPEPGEYTRLFEGPKRSPTIPAQSVPQPAVPPAAPPPPVVLPTPYVNVAAPQAPSYQVAPPQFQQPAPPTYAMAPPPAVPQMPAASISTPAFPQASSPATSKKPRFLVPLIILGCLFIGAIVLIVFFALKH